MSAWLRFRVLRDAAPDRWRDALRQAEVELARTMSTAPALLLSAPTDFQDPSAPPGGFEPPTVGLEGRIDSEQFRALSADLERLRSKAREYLASVGQPHERHAAITLAEAVLDATEETPCEARREVGDG